MNARIQRYLLTAQKVLPGDITKRDTVTALTPEQPHRVIHSFSGATHKTAGCVSVTHKQIDRQEKRNAGIWGARTGGV